MKIINILLASMLFYGGFANAQSTKKSAPIAAPIDRSVRPNAMPAQSINLPKPTTFTLDNGLKVFIVENNKLPMVSFSLQFDYDPILENEKAGLVEMAGSLLGTGTKTKTKSQIDQSVDILGATLATSATGIYAQSLTRHSETLVDIMADILLNAEFRQEEFERIKTQTLSGLQTGKSDPNTMSNNAVDVVFYGKNHPYGEIITEATVNNIELNSCFEFYKKNMVPNVAYLAIVGDISVSKAKELVEKAFGNWKQGEVPTRVYRQPTPAATTQVTLVPKTGAVQSIIKIGHPIALKPGAPDAIAASVMNNILGGSMNGRLFRNLRETKAYTYGAYSSLRANKLVGSFICNASVRNNVTDSAIVEFLSELNRINETNVEKDELQRSISTLAGNFAFSLEDPRTIAEFAINTEKYGLNPNYYQEYLKALSNITTDDVAKAAKKYINPNNLHIIVVGDKSLKENLSSFSADGKVNLINQYGEPIVDLKPIPAGITANIVIENYLNAIGGVKNLNKIKDVSTQMETTIQGMPLKVALYQKTPHFFMQSLEMNGMSMQKSVFNGNVGKVSGMQGNKNITGNELSEMKANSMIFRELTYQTAGLKANLKGIDVIKGEDAYVVEFIYPTGKVDTEYYSLKTGLKIRSERFEGEGDAKVMQFTEYENYTAVNKVLFPHKLIQNVGGMELVLNVKSIQINKKLKDDFFN